MPAIAGRPKKPPARVPPAPGPSSTRHGRAVGSPSPSSTWPHEPDPPPPILPLTREKAPAPTCRSFPSPHDFLPRRTTPTPSPRLVVSICPPSDCRSSTPCRNRAETPPPPLLLVAAATTSSFFPLFLAARHSPPCRTHRHAGSRRGRYHLLEHRCRFRMPPLRHLIDVVPSQ
jgi:hypothetical protein